MVFSMADSQQSDPYMVAQGSKRVCQQTRRKLKWPFMTQLWKSHSIPVPYSSFQSCHKLVRFKGEGLRPPHLNGRSVKVCSHVLKCRLTQLLRSLPYECRSQGRLVGGSSVFLSTVLGEEILQGIPHLLENSILGLKVPSRMTPGFLCWGSYASGKPRDCATECLAEFSLLVSFTINKPH